MIKILVLARNTGLNILIEWIYLQRKRLIYGFEIEYRGIQVEEMSYAFTKLQTMDSESCYSFMSPYKILGVMM